MDEAVFPVVARIRAARRKSEIAVILLRLPDAILCERLVDIAAACEEARFADAVSFVHMRVAALCAMRTADGRLPRAAEAPLEIWRETLVQHARESA